MILAALWSRERVGSKRKQAGRPSYRRLRTARPRIAGAPGSLAPTVASRGGAISSYRYDMSPIGTWRPLYARLKQHSIFFWRGTQHLVPAQVSCRTFCASMAPSSCLGKDSRTYLHENWQANPSCDAAFRAIERHTIARKRMKVHSRALVAGAAKHSRKTLRRRPAVRAIIAVSPCCVWRHGP